MAYLRIFPLPERSFFLILTQPVCSWPLEGKNGILEVHPHEYPNGIGKA